MSVCLQTSACALSCTLHAGLCRVLGGVKGLGRVRMSRDMQLQGTRELVWR